METKPPYDLFNSLEDINRWAIDEAIRFKLLYGDEIARPIAARIFEKAMELSFPIKLKLNLQINEAGLKNEKS